MQKTNFESVPNQRRITVHRSPMAGRFTQVGVDVNLSAMKNLSYSAFMLYMYFCHNADGYDLWLSKAWLTQNTALKKNTYYAAFSELLDKGYLQRKPEGTSLFDFYDAPMLFNGTGYTEKQEQISPKEGQNIYKYTKDTQGDKTQAPSLDAQCAVQVIPAALNLNL